MQRALITLITLLILGLTTTIGVSAQTALSTGFVVSGPGLISPSLATLANQGLTVTLPGTLALNGRCHPDEEGQAMAQWEPSPQDGGIGSTSFVVITPAVCLLAQCQDPVLTVNTHAPTLELVAPSLRRE